MEYICHALFVGEKILEMLDMALSVELVERGLEMDRKPSITAAIRLYGIRERNEINNH